ncbi:hypothetical protein L873DRAFT_1785679 [Choiromyces venosus 120613-1]|uniref:Uncharacterized protein n=1 Tax=Choiromyces venosus 120613-1 TaxID=1336337 RepID=A0A3N4KAQ1_9PEZI|nr:hypothetical protein L873DRAFT_1785679 [Choiromyces venosus 120613-1]
MTFFRLVRAAAPAPFKPFARAVATVTRTTHPSSTATADRAIPPPLTSKGGAPKVTTVTVTVRPKTTTISLEEEPQAQPTSSESAYSTHLDVDGTSETQVSSTSNTQDFSTTATSTTSQASITPSTIFGLGDGGQIVHSGVLNGTTLTTDGSTFAPSATPTPTTTSESGKPRNRLPKGVIIGIIASSCIALLSLLAVIFWWFRKRRHKRGRKKRDSKISVGSKDEEAGGRDLMRQSSQVKRMKISHPFTAIYERPATVSVRDLQSTAPWNIPESVVSQSSAKVLLPPAPSTSEAISPYGSYFMSDDDDAGDSSPGMSNVYPQPPAMRALHPQSEIREPFAPVRPPPPPRDQPRFPASPHNARQSPCAQRPQPEITRTSTVQKTSPFSSIWDDDVSIVKPFVDMRRDAYPGIPHVEEEDEGRRPSLEQERRVSSLLSDHQHGRTWGNTGHNTFSIASSHPSLRVPESGNWKQNHRSIRETVMSGDDGDTLDQKSYDPRDDLTLKREEIEGLRVSTILPKNNRWERTRKLFSGERS